MKKKVTQSPQKIEIPLDIALSLLTPDELAKLKKYVAMYFAKHGNGSVAPKSQSGGI